MTKEARITNTSRSAWHLRISLNFGIRISFVIRHSGFGIRVVITDFAKASLNEMVEGVAIFQGELEQAVRAFQRQFRGDVGAMGFDCAGADE